MKKFFVFCLSVMIFGFLILPFNSAQAEKYICDCKCMAFTPLPVGCTETYWYTDSILTSAADASTQDHMCYSKCLTAHTPDNCTLGGENSGIAESCKVATCVGWNPNYSCVDTSKRNGGSEGCESGLCTGASNIKCCPPAAAAPAAETKTETGGGNGLPGGITNPLGTTSIPGLIGKVIKAILGIVGSIAFLMFIYGGFLWMTAAGESKKVEKGKETLVWATIGLATIFFAYAATSFVIKSLTGGAGGAGTEQTSQVTQGFCLCKVSSTNAFWTKLVFSESECENKGVYSECVWKYGSCKEGSRYYPRVDKEQCLTTPDMTYEGSE